MILKILSEVIVCVEAFSFLRGTGDDIFHIIFFPAILIGMKCDAFVACMRMPRKRRMCPAARRNSIAALTSTPLLKCFCRRGLRGYG